MVRTNKILNIGIDLGTSRSAVACDNGMRTFVPSYVGFPKDAVSRKMLGKDIVFGDEATKHRLALDMHRPFDKGQLKYTDVAGDPEENAKAKKVARELLKHLVQLVAEEEEVDLEDLTIRGVLGAPALASRKNKKNLLDVADGVLDDVMIVSEPFAVAYGLDLFHSTLIVDIGAGTVDLCRMSGTIPTEKDQITTLNAGDHIDRIFLDLIKQKHEDVDFTVAMIKRFKEENAFISKQEEKVLIELPVKGKPVSYDVTQELKEACMTIVPEIVGGIRQLVASFDPEFQRGLKRNVILAGGGSQMVGLRKQIEDFMKKTLGYGRVTCVEEPLYAGANGALKLCKDMPDEYWDELKSDNKKEQARESLTRIESKRKS